MAVEYCFLLTDVKLSSKPADHSFINPSPLLTPEFKPKFSSQRHLAGGKWGGHLTPTKTGSTNSSPQSPRRGDNVQQQTEECEKVILKVTGMTCASCVANIERHIIKVEGE